MTQEKKPTGLDLLRVPFPANQISKLPKPTKAQTDEVRRDFKKGICCTICGGWHHPKVVHLDYVGHAALTDRLLDCDPSWNWEPVSIADDGTPRIDSNGGMWIKLTVCGITRLGYGHADGKSGGDAIKEVIGDALRNAAMRFGAALDLWHKGDLHGIDDESEAKDTPKQDQREQKPQEIDTDHIAEAARYLGNAESLDDLKSRWQKLPKAVQRIAAVVEAKDKAKAGLDAATWLEDLPLTDDEIPY